AGGRGPQPGRRARPPPPGPGVRPHQPRRTRPDTHPIRPRVLQWSPCAAGAAASGCPSPLRQGTRPMTGCDAIKSALEGTKAVLNRYLSDLSDADLFVRPVPAANHSTSHTAHLTAPAKHLITRAG